MHAIERIQVLCLDDINVVIKGTLQQFNHMGIVEHHAISSFKAATPVVSAEGFFEAIGPYLDTTVGYHA